MTPFEPKVFDCGCTVTLESDDSNTSRTCDVFDLERCGAHSLDAVNSGPIDAYLASFVPAAPLSKTAVPTEAERRRSAPRPVPKRNQLRREYYASHREDYGKYELNRLKAMLSREKDTEKISRLMKRIERREVADGKCPTFGCGGIAGHGGACQVAQKSETAVDR